VANMPQPASRPATIRDNSNALARNNMISFHSG
jgi:hypothetical protein